MTFRSRSPGSRASLVAARILSGLLILLPVTPGHAADTVLERAVVEGERLEIRNYNGKIRVIGWDRARLRIEADHPGAETIVAERRGATWLVVPSSWRRDSGAFQLDLPDVGIVRVEGREPPPVDLVISMPAWMAVEVETPRGEVVVEGAVGPLDVTSMIGDIVVHGGGTPMRLRSMIGRIELHGGRGRTTLEGTRGRIEVRGSSGDLRIETTTGDIVLGDLSTTDVEVTTIGGDISLTGPLTREGQYEFTTHSGDVELALPGSVDARFAVRALRGRILSDLSTGPLPEDGRAEFTLGDGTARVRLESFSGRIRLRQLPR